MTLRAFLAAHPPMETWSSVAALVESESTDEGWQRALFSETARDQCKLLTCGFPQSLQSMEDGLLKLLAMT